MQDGRIYQVAFFQNIGVQVFQGLLWFHMVFHEDLP